MSPPYFVISMGSHLALKSSSICTSLSVVQRKIASCNPCASAALSAGGYSLSADVDQLPVSSRPMDDELGTFWAICHMRKICTKLGAFSTRREVGLGDLAPHKPCASVRSWHPGSACKRATSGVLQIETESSFFGAAGCSVIATPPCTVKVSHSFQLETHQFIAYPHLLHFTKAQRLLAPGMLRSSEYTWRSSTVINSPFTGL